MINKKYIKTITEIIKKRSKTGERVFIFGSSVESERFGDVDLAIVSDDSETDGIIRKIKDDLEESTLPYKFDVVNINQARDSFRNRVMNGPKIWII